MREGEGAGRFAASTHFCFCITLTPHLCSAPNAMDDKLARHDTSKGSECAFSDAHSAAPKFTSPEHPMDGGRAAWLTVLGG